MFELTQLLNFRHQRINGRALKGQSKGFAILCDIVNGGLKLELCEIQIAAELVESRGHGNVEGGGGGLQGGGGKGWSGGIAI